MHHLSPLPLTASVLQIVSIIHAPSLPPSPNCNCAADGQCYSFTISPPSPSPLTASNCGLTNLFTIGQTCVDHTHTSDITIRMKLLLRYRDHLLVWKLCKMQWGILKVHTPLQRLLKLFTNFKSGDNNRAIMPEMLLWEYSLSCNIALLTPYLWGLG